MDKRVNRVFLRKVFPTYAFAVALIPAMAFAQENMDAAAQEESDPAAQESAEPAAQENTDPAAQENAEPAAQEASDQAAQETVSPPAPESADVDTVPVAPLAQDTQALGTAVTLDDIIVTSEKRAASIQEVPLTVNALTGQMLDKQGIRDFEEVQKLVPGLFLENNDPLTPNIGLRGVPFDPNANTNPTTDVYFNEVPIYAYVAFQSMFDVERIEVLRGAQTTLRARTSPGGAITIAPRKPNLGAWDAYVSGQSSTNDNNFQLAGGGPLIDGIIGVRFAAMSDTNGMNGVTNIIGNHEEKATTRAARVVVEARPLESESLGITLTHQYLKTETTPYSFALQSVPGSTRDPYIDAYDRKARTNTAAYLNDYAPITTLAIDWDDVFAGHTLNMVTGYQTGYRDSYRDLDAGNAWPAAYHPQSIYIDLAEPWWTQELQLSSPQDQPWRYRVGGYYDKIKVEVTIQQPQHSTASPDPNTPPQSTWDLYLFVPLDHESYSYFAETALDIGEKWSVELGARQGSVTYTTQALLTARNSPLGQALGLTNFPVIPERLATVYPKPLTGHLVASYHVTKDVNTYARFARSNRQNGINIEAIAVSTSLGPDLLAFEEEYADSLELGLKSDWLDGRLRFNTSLYQQNFDGYISKSPFVAYDTDRNGQQDGVLSIGFNGDAVVKGIDAEVTYLWSENLQLSLLSTYAVGRFDNAVTPCNKLDANGDPEFTDENGNSGQQVAKCYTGGPIGPLPEFSTTVLAEQTWPLSPFDLFLRGSYRYNGERGQPGDVTGAGLPAYGVANLFLGAHDAAQTWEVSLWGKNIFDEQALLAGGIGELQQVSDGSVLGTTPMNPQVFNSGYSAVFPIPEREIGVSLRYAW